MATATEAPPRATVTELPNGGDPPPVDDKDLASLGKSLRQHAEFDRKYRKRTDDAIAGLLRRIEDLEGSASDEAVDTQARVVRGPSGPSWITRTTTALMQFGSVSLKWLKAH